MTNQPQTRQSFSPESSSVQAYLTSLPFPLCSVVDNSINLRSDCHVVNFSDRWPTRWRCLWSFCFSPDLSGLSMVPRLIAARTGRHRRRLRRHHLRRLQRQEVRSRPVEVCCPSCSSKVVSNISRGPSSELLFP